MRRTTADRLFRGWILASAIVGCAPEFPAVPEDCRVTELAERVALAPPDRTDLLVVIDTHASDAAERAAIADRLAPAVGLVASGDIDGDDVRDFEPIDDLVIALSSAEPGCGVPAVLEWRATAESPGDPDALADAVRDATLAMPACERSVPVETAALVLPATRREHAFEIVVAVTDEDEPGAPDRVDALLAAAAGGLGPLAVAIVAGLDPSSEWDRRGDPAILGCDVPPVSAGAAPGLAQATIALEARGSGVSVWSMCATSWLEAVAWSVPLLPNWNPCFCLPRGADVGGCAMTEQLSPAGYHHRCADLEGRDPVAIGAIDGAERCTVLPSDGTSPGWIDAAAMRTCELVCGAAPAITWIGADPEPGSIVDLRCTRVEGACALP